MVLAAGFFADDLAAAAGFLATWILRITMIHKPNCTSKEDTCKPIGIEISRRAPSIQDNYAKGHAEGPEWRSNRERPEDTLSPQRRSAGRYLPRLNLLGG
jgi:hypothetical protein